jgi:hypothetical protein
MSGPLHYDPKGEVARQRRLENQSRRLGDRDARCSQPGCPEHDLFALTGTAPSVRCYEHRVEAVGRTTVEGHHPAGKANDPTTVPVPGNDHRILNDLQRDWPTATLRNLEGSPLIRAAAALRGWLDVLWLILTRTVAWIPAALEWLDQLLTERLGAGWWEALGWTPA